MSTRTASPFAGLSWLKRGFNVGRHNPRAVLGGAALLGAVAVLPSLVQMLLIGVAGPLAGAVASVLLSVALLAPLTAGFLRVIDAAEQGRPVQATDVFGPFRSGDAGRFIGLGFAIMGLYLLVAMVLMALFGDGLPEWQAKVMEQMQQRQGRLDPKSVPPLPEGTGPLIGLGMLGFSFLGGVYAIAFGQAALRGRATREAITDGLAGTARNVLPMVLLLIVVVLGLLLLSLPLTLVFGLLGLLVALLGNVVGGALLMVIYVVALTVMYTVMFGVAYHLWRDVTEGDASATTPPAVPPPHEFAA